MPDPTTPNSPPRPMAGNRLAKTIARHGLCSRRQAETWITAGRVAVNGKIIRTPAFNVIESDKIAVDDTPLIERRGTRVWLYHKPAGLVVTESDPDGRKTIFEDLAQRGLPRVLTVGRLDINTEGLLLLTNDGGLKRVLELPATGWLRRYRVRAHGSIEQDALDRLKNGIVVEGIRYGPIEAKLERVQGSNVWLLVALKEGKNREIKKVLSSLGLQVNRLIRTSFGPFQLGDIPTGGLDTIKARVLQDQLGKKLAKAAGVDFEAEMPEPLEQAKTGVRSPNTRFKSKLISAGNKTPRGEKQAEEPRKPAPRGRTGDKRFKEEKSHRGRGQPLRKDERDAVEKRRVHFGGERGTEMFEPKAKKKGDETDGRRGGRGGDARGRPERPRSGGAGRPGRSERPDRPARSDRSSRPNRSGPRK